MSYDIRYALKPVKSLYGTTPAKDFGPLNLKAVRVRMVETGWSRKTVNKQVGRVKRAFRWAVSEELIPASVDHGLSTVTGLKRGRTVARETAKVKPVADAVVNATLPHLPPIVAAMVRIQILSGMRPGEVCRMRGCELDATAEVWTYQPAAHKNDWRGTDRIICIGPRCQDVLRPFLKPDPDAYLFDPRESEERRAKSLRQRRATPLYPSHVRRQEKRKAGRGRRAFRDHYSVTGYNKAIGRACDNASVPAWHANQLRHSHGTAVRRRYGLDGAQVALGHATADTTQIYAEADLSVAQRIAREVG